MKTISPNQSSLQKRLSSLRDELSKTETPLYPNDPYLHIKEWIAKATPIMHVDWPNIFDDFNSQVAISDWTNLGFAAYGGSLPGSSDHQQAWARDVKEAQEFRQKVLYFLDGLLALPSNNAQEMQLKRFQFLKKLYDVTEADESAEVDPSVLGAELGLSTSEIDRICGFLSSEGSIEFVNILDLIGITHKGIVEVEHALSKLSDNKGMSRVVSILFLAADPSDASRLRLGEELREIQEKLQLAKLREQFKLHQRTSVRPVDISQALLDEQPQIVHFSGHSMATGALCFENQMGETHPIQPNALAALFEQFASQVKCVVLNACYSEIQANAISAHVDYVVGMNEAIGDRAAIAFSIGFYQALGAGRTIDDAYKLGCVQIRLQNIPEHLTPVLIKKRQAQA